MLCCTASHTIESSTLIAPTSWYGAKESVSQRPRYWTWTHDIAFLEFGYQASNIRYSQHFEQMCSLKRPLRTSTVPKAIAASAAVTSAATTATAIRAVVASSGLGRVGGLRGGAVVAVSTTVGSAITATVGIVVVACASSITCQHFKIPKSFFFNQCKDTCSP